jgi:hypothetical protein
VLFQVACTFAILAGGADRERAARSREFAFQVLRDLLKVGWKDRTGLREKVLLSEIRSRVPDAWERENRAETENAVTFNLVKAPGDRFDTRVFFHRRKGGAKAMKDLKKRLAEETPFAPKEAVETETDGREELGKRAGSPPPRRQGRLRRNELNESIPRSAAPAQEFLRLFRSFVAGAGARREAVGLPVFTLSGRASLRLPPRRGEVGPGGADE